MPRSQFGCRVSFCELTVLNFKISKQGFVARDRSNNMKLRAQCGEEDLAQVLGLRCGNRLRCDGDTFSLAKPWRESTTPIGGEDAEFPIEREGPRNQNVTARSL